ncbi:thiamine pyrophosphate-binding protein [Actinomycetospora lutea]|uniref:thiamine pyrophosphate-binding protein n=1 Tax=Actinomycetospora lutea TaxID=663604 RepID=UPI002365855F|nr:thiamine pyrophosphate-binding protein [Actinomycetospora lutea]MDD7939196.1 thiamine pyrophosphate-binding protein [Actinomycetospora lutea]
MSTVTGSTGADLVVACLAAEGVDVVAGVPGTTVMDVIDAIARHDRVRYLATRHEQVAGFLADGLSRGGGLGACLVSRGPGAANAAIAVQNAYDESVPMLLLVGQVADRIVERRAFEEADVVATFRPMSKWAVEVRRADRIPELLQRAVRTAVTGRPGPVVVSLPLDVLQDTVEGVAPARRWRARPPAPDAEGVAAAAAVIAEAARPLVIVGGGAAGAPGVLTALADRAGAPLVTTWLRQGAVSHDHPAYLGSLGYGVHDVTWRAAAEADVVVALGCRFSEFSTRRWTLLAEDVRLVHVDVDPVELGRVYVPEIGLVADAAAAATALTAALPAPPAERLDRRKRLRVEYEEASSPDSPVLDADDPRGGVSSRAAVAALQPLAERDDVRLVQDAPSFGPWTHRYLRLPGPGRFSGSAGGAMAWGLPAAMGLTLADPARRAVCVSGDGSFWMVAQDLETCVREGIPVVNVVMNNNAYGNTRDRQRLAHEERYLGVFYGNADLAAFARSLGGFGVRVERDEELAPALRAALDQDLPAVIDVIQDPMYGLPPGLVPPASR